MAEPTRYDRVLSTARSLVITERACVKAATRLAALPPGSTTRLLAARNRDFARKCHRRDNVLASLRQACADAGVTGPNVIAALESVRDIAFDNIKRRDALLGRCAVVVAAHLRMLEEPSAVPFNGRRPKDGYLTNLRRLLADVGRLDLPKETDDA